MSEIEEFLKRAAAMRAQQARQAPPRTAPVVRRPMVAVDEVLDAEVIEVDEVSGDDVARDVQKHLDTAEFQRRAARLAEKVRASDDRIEAHLHQAFEHRLGQLGASTTAAEDSTLDTEEAAAAQAAQPVAGRIDLRAMLLEPHAVRNAIIMGELLNRPTYRW